MRHHHASNYAVCPGSQAHALKATRGDPQTGLNDRPWTTCVQWLPKSRLVCGTAHHKVRLYDVEAQRRPLVQVAWLDACVTALSPTLEQDVTWVGNAKGFIQVLQTPTAVLMSWCVLVSCFVNLTRGFCTAGV